MVLISRALSGLAVGLSVAVAFTYFGVSYEKYVEDQHWIVLMRNEWSEPKGSSSVCLTLAIHWDLVLGAVS